MGELNLLRIGTIYHYYINPIAAEIEGGIANAQDERSHQPTSPWLVVNFLLPRQRHWDKSSAGRRTNRWQNNSHDDGFSAKRST